jgi:hypothetical protein
LEFNLEERVNRQVEELRDKMRTQILQLELGVMNMESGLNQTKYQSDMAAIQREEQKRQQEQAFMGQMLGLGVQAALMFAAPQVGIPMAMGNAAMSASASRSTPGSYMRPSSSSYQQPYSGPPTGPNGFA